MNDMFAFEPAPWELLVDSMKAGATLSATRFLAATDGEDEGALEAAFEALLARRVSLDISALPLSWGSGELEQRLRFEHQLSSGSDLISQLEEEDPLRLYLEDLAAIPAQGDENVLADLLLTGDDTAGEKLTALLLHRAVAAAQACTGHGVLLMDLIQEASLGLWQGVLHYTGGDIRESTDWWIAQSLARVVILQARESGTVEAFGAAMKEYERCDRLLLDRLGRNATLEEIALEMAVTPEQAELAREMLRSAREMQALKQPPKADEEEDQAVEDTAYFQSRQRVQELLTNLSAVEAQVLSLRFGLEGGKPLTPQDVGQRLGITAEQVVEMEAAALAKLRS